MNQAKVLNELKAMVLAEIQKRQQTMEQFCWENDLNKATLSNFLNDKKDFRVSTLEQIAKALNKKLVVTLK